MDAHKAHHMRCNLCGCGLTVYSLICEHCRDFALCSNKSCPKLNYGQPAEAGENMCVVCTRERISHVLLPCGFAGVCAKCAAMVVMCPWCRKPVPGNERIYVGKKKL